MRKYLLASALALSLSVAQAGTITLIQGLQGASPPGSAGLSYDLDQPTFLSGTGVGTDTLTIYTAFENTLPNWHWSLVLDTTHTKLAGGMTDANGAGSHVGTYNVNAPGWFIGVNEVSISYVAGIAQTIGVTVVVPEPHEYAMLAGLGLFGAASPLIAGSAPNNALASFSGPIRTGSA